MSMLVPQPEEPPVSQRAEPAEPPPVQPSGPSPEPDPFGPVADAVDGMRMELAALGDQFHRRLLNDRDTRRSLDGLLTELGHARKIAEGRIVQPLLYDLVLLLDRVERATGHGQAFADSVTAELLALLEKYGMTRIPVAHGPFDSGAQEAVGTIATPSPEVGGEVAEVVRHGYRMNERIVRPQQVRVYTDE